MAVRISKYLVHRALGIDLGGTKIEGSILEVDESGIRTLIRRRTNTNRDLGYQSILASIHRLSTELIQDAGVLVDSVGIGIPGSLDSEGRVRNANTTILNGKPLRRDLESMFSLPLRIENDANCFALAEARWGAAKDAKVVFGVIMGTGVGGGIVINGEVWSGRQGIAGEWGHNVLVSDGQPCWCGKQGCVEQYLSGPAVEARYALKTGNKLSLEEIVQGEATDEAAQCVMRSFVKHFGVGISTIANLLDPDVIVLGGGLSNIECLYEDGKKEAERHLFCPNGRLDIRKPLLGDSAGVLGAALLGVGTTLSKQEILN